MSNEDPTDLFSIRTTGGATSDRPFTEFSAPGYSIERLIGEGAFGAVYHAKRNSDQREFAIKLLKLDNSQNTGLDRNRFLREAVVLCQLQHPKIVSFRELGMSGDIPYIVMDYVPTVSWKELCKAMTIVAKMKLAVGITTHCLEALVFAHSKGIVHRDIKPSNVLLERKDKKLIVRLADFGLAKNYYDAGHSGITDDRQFGGTVGYMAPELVEGYRYFKPVSDQYSIAATLYEMIAARPPVKHNPRANPIIAIRDNQFSPIESLVPEVPTALRAWIHRGLATSPDNRFTNTEEMLACLRQVDSSSR
jgi:eukaryotic-like serine/threonine-protein kinase